MNRSCSSSALLFLLILAVTPFAISQNVATRSALSHYRVLYTLPGSKVGIGPNGVIRDTAGNLYGMTGEGGDIECDLTGSLGCGAA
jgi:hypothetical protein